MPTAFKRSGSMAVVAALCCVVLAGCGDDSPQAVATTEPSASSSATPSRTAPATPAPATVAPTTPPATATTPAAPPSPESAPATTAPPASAATAPPAQPTATPSAQPSVDPHAGLPAVDVCTLGTDAIADLLGAGATPTADEADPGTCFWTNASREELIVDVSSSDEWVPASALPGYTAEPVPGLGEEAWASLGSPSNLQVAWRRGNISASISASLDNGGSDLIDVAQTIDAALRSARP